MLNVADTERAFRRLEVLSHRVQPVGRRGERSRYSMVGWRWFDKRTHKAVINRKYFKRNAVHLFTLADSTSFSFHMQWLNKLSFLLHREHRGTYFLIWKRIFTSHKVIIWMARWRWWGACLHKGQHAILTMHAEKTLGSYYMKKKWLTNVLFWN